MSLPELAREADLEANYLESVLDGDKEPPRGVIELVARALDLLPQHFLDYRLAAVIDALSHDPDRANELFLESLTELERRNVDVSGFDNRRFPEAVRGLLAEEELTQGELAESIGLSQSELSLILNGRRPLHADLPALIAQALGVHPEFFLAHRLALLGEWLRDRPDEIDTLLESLERAVDLPAYQSWPIADLPDPRRVSLVELARSLMEIVHVEGPVLGERVYRLRLRSAGIQTETRELRSLLNRASYAAMKAGAVIGVNERPERTQKYLVLRLRGTPAVRMRQRGDRSVPEIPLAEVRAVVEATRAYRYGEPVAAVQNEVLTAYEVRQPRLADVEHINRAINARSGL